MTEPLPLVLLVDDDADMRDALMMALDDSGYQVQEATNGVEALEFLRGGGRPSLIVLDLMMPVMDGYTFCEERLRLPELHHVPVLVTSAGVQDARLEQLGVSAFLAKPFALKALLDAVERHRLR